MKARAETGDRGAIVRRRFGGLLAALLGLIAVVFLFDSTPGSNLVRDQIWALGSLHYSEFDRKLPARQATEWYVGMGPGDLDPEAETPSIEPGGGIFTGPVKVRVAAASDSKVRCSADGRIPIPNDPVFEGEVTLTKTTVLRCRTFMAEHQPSATITQTYLINIAGQLPVLALTIHPSGLWNRYTGIYERFNEKGKEWERDGHVEYFQREGEPALTIDGRVRLHGGYSRAAAKKSFRFYFKPLSEEMSDPQNILTWQTPANERAVVFGARESDVSRDELFADVFEAAGGMTSARMPVFMYLNGEPWGIYFIREQINHEYLERRVGPGQYDLLASEPVRPRVIDGDRKYWNQMLAFLEQNDLADDALFDTFVAQYIDVENFIDYWLFNVYGANADWPHHNMSMFARKDGLDRRWRWICWDADGTFDFGKQGLHHDTLAWATRSTLRHDLRFNNHLGALDVDERVGTTFLARKLLENERFKARLTIRMHELLETSLSSSAVELALERLHGQLQADLRADWDRWAREANGAAQAQVYDEDLERVRRFIHERPAIIKRLFKQLDSPNFPRQQQGVPGTIDQNITKIGAES
jgi:hypothetical protein